MSIGGAGKVVCVTGASGYIASWLVKCLLQQGYTVKASVLDPNDPLQTDHLHQLLGANERLQLFKADLLDEGSFDTVVDGCEGVFHTACPCYFGPKDPQAELIDPAVKGTLNVLSSCAKTSSVKKVIVTSSMATVYCNRKPRNPEVVVDETWFSDPEFCKESELWYPLAKTIAEESAWKFAKSRGIDMVTIHPGMVIGPLLQPTLNTSAGMILNLINGAKTYMNQSGGIVDVRDVARAHILAFEIFSASGRYLLVERVAHFSDILNILRKTYPDLLLPEKCSSDEPFAPTYKVSNKKRKSLGIELIPLEVSLKDIVESLKEKNFCSL
ncbi:hypothetical protein ACHQM5_016130 [Ranunculus cassubicifolius]